MKKFSSLLISVLFLVGCEDKRTDISDKAGETVGEHITEFTRSIGKGIDKKLMVKVSLSPEVEGLGLTHTTAKAVDMDMGRKRITVYFIASKDVDVTLKGHAFNSDDAEIGRCKTPVKLAKEDAGYFVFEFPEEMDSMTVKEYRISL